MNESNKHHRYNILLSILAVLVILFAIKSHSLQKEPQQKKDVAVLSVNKIKSINDIDKSVIISNNSEQKTDKSVQKIVRDPDAITSEAYIVGNLKTGKIYFEKNSVEKFPIASLSKLFTALVVTHILDQSKLITITEDILNTYGDAGHLVKDEKFTPHELLYPLLIESSNDAAEAYAQSFGYKEFIDYMNSFALEIGMSNTFFNDASGLNPANISTAKDLFTLSRYLYKNEQSILEITRQKTFEFSTTTNHGSHLFLSINPFVFYTPFIGGKTGRTEEARESMVSMFNIVKEGVSYPIAVILLRSEFGEREIDTEKILDKFIEM